MNNLYNVKELSIKHWGSTRKHQQARKETGFKMALRYQLVTNKQAKEGCEKKYWDTQRAK